MKLKKFKIIQNVFVILSILFILGCCFFYGQRLIKYYKIFNPKNDTGEKTEIFSATVRQNNPVVSENDGLYIYNGDFVFKGEDVNNYVSYMDKIWRIMVVNRNGSVKLVLNEPLPETGFDENNNPYNISDIHQYIKENVNIKENSLEKMVICLDTIDDIKKITCENKVEEYVSLMSINDYANSININTGKTFISSTKGLWLSNKTTDGQAWYILNNTLKVADPNKKYSVKATIVLKGTAHSISGDGTKEKPYAVKDGE